MNRYFQRRYVLSEEGAANLIRSLVWTTLLDVSYFLPVGFAMLFLADWLNGLLSPHATPRWGMGFAVGAAVVSLGIILVVAMVQYSSVYERIYEESAQRRIALAEKLKKLPLSFFAKKDVSDLSATVMEDATVVENLFSHAVPQLYGAAATTTLVGVMIVAYNWRMGLAVLWVVPVAVLVFALSRRSQAAAHKRAYGLKRAVSETVQEGLDFAQTIKSHNGELGYLAKLNAQLDEYRRVLVRGELVLGATVNICYSILRLGLPSVLICGAVLVANGTIGVFVYLAYILIASRIYAPIDECMNNFAALLFLRVRLDRMAEIDAMPLQEGSTEFAPASHDIEFRNVSFSYEEGLKTISDLSFTAKQGEVTALIGPSGGGKSTVAKLAARFWDIDGGVITLGGHDIAGVDPETLLAHYAIVFQEVTLFNASVLENIRLGRKGATDEEVRRVAELAQCDEFVSELPQGYDTLIGENGERLSGGERQRLSIARAMLKDAPIVLLDEATASLDAENESKIQRALGELVRHKTVIVIAHRLRTVSNADKIVVIKEGSIAESGTPRELAAFGGVYAALLEAQ